ncbi:MAG: putative peptidoglycan lipid II flippase [Alphaproteobacteria bacterium]|jgi:putative peptidoglycan lipid II flippase
MSLIKSGLAVASGTAMSRITGFIRDILVAKFLGASDAADIWVAAFRFPNMFRRIIAEGAFNAAFLPVYSEAIKKHGTQAGDSFAGRMLSRMSIIVGLGILLCQLFMPYLVYLIAPGYSQPLTQWLGSIIYSFANGTALLPFPNLGYSEKISLTITMTIICLPYAGFMFLAAIQSAILNYHNKFMMAAMVAVILNMALILSLIGSAFFGYNPLIGMGWASFIAGLLQSIMLYVILKKAGLDLSFKKPIKDHYHKKFFKLFIPGMISGGVTQINLLTGSIIASFTSGAMAYLYYADRIYQLPLSLIGVSLGIVLLPSLIKSYQNNALDDAKNLLARAMEFAAFSTFPAIFALMIIPDNIVKILFETGAFTAQDTQATALILSIYGFGLPAFIGIKLFSPAYYANHDTKTPMIYATWSIVINIILSFALFPIMKFYAIPTASIIAGWFNVLALSIGLYRQKMLIFSPQTMLVIKKIILSCFIMSLFLGIFKYYLLTYFGTYQRIGMVLMIIFGMALYFVACYATAIFPRSLIKTYLKK